MRIFFFGGGVGKGVPSPLERGACGLHYYHYYYYASTVHYSELCIMLYHMHQVGVFFAAVRQGLNFFSPARMGYI